MRRNILITGSTAFIGSWLLNELSKDPDNYFFLLIRPPAPKRFISKILNHPFAKESFSGLFERCKIFEGDISQDQLGVTESEYADLIQNTTDIFHCAAASIHNVNVEKIMTANVVGCRQMAELAQNCLNLKSFNFTSSFAVGLAEHNFFATNVQFRKWPKSGILYEMSKSKGEELLKAALAGKTNLNILRVPQIIPDSKRGEIFRWDDALIQMIGVIIKQTLSKFPYSPEIHFPVLQIDCLVELMRYIYQREFDKTCKVYTIAHPHPIHYGDFLAWTISYFKAKGVELIPIDEFSLAEASSVEKEFYRYFLTLPLLGRYNLKPGIEVEEIIKKNHLICPPQDKEYFLKIFRNLEKA